MIHELPHEIGDFAYLIKKKYNIVDIFFSQIFTSLGALMGSLIGVYICMIYLDQIWTILFIRIISFDSWMFHIYWLL
jgi:zinc transporter 7